MKIVVLDGQALSPGDLSWASFEAIAPLVVYDATPPEEIIRRIDGADLVITNKTPITQATMDACPHIRYIGVLSTGVNVVDLAAASERGIPVTNVPAYSTQAVAQMTFALLLEMTNQVGHHNAAVQAGRWAKSASFAFWDMPLIELAGLTMGIIGYGDIGKRVAIIAHALGMQTLVYDHHADAKAPPAGGHFAQFDQVLAAADVLSLHVPLTEQTQNMIRKDTLEGMKDGAFLINTARGGLLNEADVRDALQSGKLAGAAVDVAAVEPMRADNPLLGAPNCIITPHIAWAPVAARKRLMEGAATNLRVFVSEGIERNRVNR